MSSPVFKVGVALSLAALAEAETQIAHAGDHGHPSGNTFTSLSLTSTGSVGATGPNLVVPLKAYVVFDAHDVKLDQLPPTISKGANS
jgi:hypothetical protein